ncbi:MULTISPECIES: hypothetical protein [Enterococcus]|uniref:Uncharacterized protein n=1 Tax=Enterococcus alishanensis TaxID=1303817 RepID=A0ABS6TGY0_9ENTE|nr:hypothetical protein [Enterococcus alishanensis]MBV7392153.1 hypothetical protein [Enterococcus alishanensis]
MVKINRMIAVLYNLCGVALLALAGGGMAPPVGYVPPWLWISCSIPFIFLLLAHVYRWRLAKQN